MSKHTPGPWETERVYLTIEDPTMRITAHDGALYVAEAAYSHIRGEKAIHVNGADEMRANAQLIAAAPDLLEALQFLLRDADSEPDGEYLEGAGANRVAVHRKGIERARSAIAKATGEA